ncbi:MAG: aldo/keto reductase [Trueperaceae bacterium]|nr:MAG: aldo/keto reductase [Trueperaceae bacterium]
MPTAQAKWTKKIALGTVQFGLDYGISNTAGRVAPEVVAEILELAANRGIDTLDTAVAYGVSEETLGEILETPGLSFELISKFPAETSAEGFDEILAASLKRLRSETLKGYLAHTFDSFTDPRVREALTRAKAGGRIEQLGVSVYYPEQVSWLLEREIDFDLIQLPLSVFDQRFLPFLPELKARGVEVHVRSVFLQGLFFLGPAGLPPHFEKVVDKLMRLRSLCEEKAVPLSALLLNYAVLNKDLDKVVIGVQSDAELSQNLSAFEHVESCRTLLPELAELAVWDESILLPFNWPQKA